MLSQVNEEWCKGSIGSSEGMFPLSYVRLDVPLEPKPSAAPSSRAVALYAFAAETHHDLSLKVKYVQLATTRNRRWMAVQYPP